MKKKNGVLAYLCFIILGEKEIIYFYGLLIKLKKVWILCYILIEIKNRINETFKF